jgi:hypothetical protein
MCDSDEEFTDWRQVPEMRREARSKANDHTPHACARIRAHMPHSKLNPTFLGNSAGGSYAGKQQ